MMDRTPPDLILRTPAKRTKTGKVIRRKVATAPHYDGRRPIVAEVLHLTSRSHDYHHPVLALGIADKDGDIGICGDRISISFQRNAVASVHEYDKTIRGFLGDGHAGHCYAATMDVKLDHLHDAPRWIALLSRASEAGRKAGYAAGNCQLTRLVVGLRKLGVEVRIYNHALRDKKERRAAERSHARFLALDHATCKCGRNLTDGQCRMGCAQEAA